MSGGHGAASAVSCAMSTMPHHCLPTHRVRRAVAAFLVLATVAMGLVAATPPPAVNAAEPAAAASAVHAAVAHLTPVRARGASRTPRCTRSLTSVAAAHPASPARHAASVRSAPSVWRLTSPRPRESAGDASSARLVARPAVTPSDAATPGTFTLGAATVDLLAHTLSIPVGSGTLVGHGQRFDLHRHGVGSDRAADRAARRLRRPHLRRQLDLDRHLDQGAHPDDVGDRRRRDRRARGDHPQHHRADAASTSTSSSADSPSSACRSTSTATCRSPAERSPAA